MKPRTQETEIGNGRNKGGRPKLPSAQKRNCPVKVNFDRKNYGRLLLISKEAGKSLSETVYELAVNGYVKEPLSQGVVHALRVLVGMANNLNQLARLGHIHGPIYIAEENSLLSKEISGLIVRLNEQL